MTNKIALTIVALGLALPAVNLIAQDDPRPPRGPGGPGGGRPVPPLVASLDVNKDGALDQSELNAAAESLKALDKNNDGRLTPDEMGRGPGGPRKGTPPPGDAVKQNDGGQRPERRPGPPLIAALDANTDGVVDATEIANAAAALKALDKNGDGQLTMEEIGPRGPRGGGPGKKHGPPTEQE